MCATTREEDQRKGVRVDKEKRGLCKKGKRYLQNRAVHGLGVDRVFRPDFGLDFLSFVLFCLVETRLATLQTNDICCFVSLWSARAYG